MMTIHFLILLQVLETWRTEKRVELLCPQPEVVTIFLQLEFELGIYDLLLKKGRDGEIAQL